MFSIQAPDFQKNHVGRRDFLQLGGAGVLGLGLPDLLRAATRQPNNFGPGFGRAKRCIIVFLFGGPSQLDMWDMKPQATEEVRGPLKSIATNVPGIQVSELLPLTASIADKYKIVRTVCHYHNEHSAALHTSATGTYYRNITSDVAKWSREDHPHLGAIYAKWRGWVDNIPPFVQLPYVIGPPMYERWPGQNAGFLGKKYDPIVVRGDKKTADFNLLDIDLPEGLPPARVDDRRSLLQKMNEMFSTVERNPQFAEMGTLYQQVYSLLSSSGVRESINLDSESPAIRQQYGQHIFGQGLLAARRLSEAGVPLVTVYWIDPEPAGDGGGEFDSHGKIYHHYPNRLVPPTDRALHGLLTDLDERGTLDETLVVVMGEFGRTPKINGAAGRDHWAQCQSILLAGAGITGGSVYGKSDKNAAYPASNSVPIPDLAQTFLHLMGVPPEFELHQRDGRPLPACRGTVIPELFA